MTAPHRTVEARRYQRPMSRAWWLRNRRYALFMAREFSAVFMVLFVLLYLAQLRSLGDGPDAYARYLDRMQSPGWIALHLVVLAFAVLHTVTWIALLPKGLPDRLMGRRIPARAVVLGGLASWLLASAIIALVVLVQ